MFFFSVFFPDTLDPLCDIFVGIALVTETICEVYGITSEALCDAPNFLDDKFTKMANAVNNVKDQFIIDFIPHYYIRSDSNSSNTFENIQEAVQEDIDSVVVIIEYTFSILDKLLALSVLFLVFRAYRYHTEFRTKDRFDNCYITEKFKQLDADRKTRGKKSLLPLKKSERVRLVDVTSIRLCKSEKGLFKIGLARLAAHVVIALLIVIIDNGLYYLLAIIREHGYIKVETTGESEARLEIEGENFISEMLKVVFNDGFSLSINVSFDTTQCLPNGSAPNNYLSIAIAVCYFICLLMVLFQAYALRLRRRIAAYFYPEREGERLHFLYSDTLRKRQTLFKFLQGMIKRKKKEYDLEQRVSLRIFLADRYPCVRKTFKCLRISTEMQFTTCFGCDSDNDGTFRKCQGTRGCTGLYCDECLKVTNNKCAICEERFADEDIYDTIEDPHSVVTVTQNL